MSKADADTGAKASAKEVDSEFRDLEISPAADAKGLGGERGDFSSPSKETDDFGGKISMHPSIQVYMPHH